MIKIHLHDALHCYIHKNSKKPAKSQKKSWKLRHRHTSEAAQWNIPYTQIKIWHSY